MTPCRAAFALGILREWAEIRHRLQAPIASAQPIDQGCATAVLQEAIAWGKDRLDPQAGAELAAAWGLPVPPSGLAATPEEAIALAERIGYPVALKRVAPGLVHKSAGGGVILNLQKPDEVRDAFSRLIRPGEYALIQRMAPSGLELIIGAYRDPLFGPVVMFGAGGVEAELREDVTFRLVPFSEAEAEAMLEETAIGRRLLRGSREGRLERPERVLEVLRQVSGMMQEHPEIAELDLNPLIVGRPGEGIHAVDVRVILARESPVFLESAIPFRG